MTTNGIINLAETVSTYYNQITLKDIEEALLDIFNRENNKYGEKVIWYCGGTYYYGEGCRNLKELKIARANAIITRNEWLELTGIKQRIVRKHGKNKQIRKHLRRRWGINPSRKQRNRRIR